MKPQTTKEAIFALQSHVSDLEVRVTKIENELNKTREARG